MSKKRWIIVALVLFGLIVVGVSIKSSVLNNSGSLSSDGKEPENGGPATVSISATDKLNALLTPPHFNAAKSLMSGYILQESADSKTATITSTQIGDDGTIKVSVTTDMDVSFVATLKSPSSGGMVIDISDSNYQKALTEDQIVNSYGGL